MNVAQLIEKLQGIPQEADVVVRLPGGFSSIVGVIQFNHRSAFGDHEMVVLDNATIPTKFRKEAKK